MANENVMIKHKGGRVFLVKKEDAKNGRVVPGWNEVSDKLAKKLLRQYPREFEVAPKVAEAAPAPAVEAPAAEEKPADAPAEAPKKSSKKKDA